MISGAASRNGSVMVADVGRVGSNMGDASGFPKGNLAPPIILITDAGRNPHFQTHLGRIASSFEGQPTQLLKCSECRIAGRKSQRHETVAKFGTAPESCFSVTPKPDRHTLRSGPR